MPDQNDAPDFMTRVIEEFNELQTRRIKLSHFLRACPSPDTMPPGEVKRLTRQSHYMALYADVLDERIKAQGTGWRPKE